MTVQRVDPHPSPLPEGEGVSLPLHGPQRGHFVAHGEGGGEGSRGTRRVSSEQLFAGGAVELQIDHRGVLYRLKQTALGKLILTK